MSVRETTNKHQISKVGNGRGKINGSHHSTKRVLLWQRIKPRYIWKDLQRVGERDPSQIAKREHETETVSGDVHGGKDRLLVGHT